MIIFKSSRRICSRNCRGLKRIKSKFHSSVFVTIVLCDEISCLPERITFTRKSIMLVKNLHFFRLSLTFFCSIKSTIWMNKMSSSASRGKITLFVKYVKAQCHLTDRRMKIIPHCNVFGALPRSNGLRMNEYNP